MVTKKEDDFILHPIGSKFVRLERVFGGGEKLYIDLKPVLRDSGLADCVLYTMICTRISRDGEPKTAGVSYILSNGRITDTID